MTLSWRQLEGADAFAAWQQVVDTCDHATFFHTPAWARAFSDAIGDWYPDPAVIEYSDGNIGVLPMMGRHDSEHRESMAPYVYGGPLFLRPPTDDHLDEIGKVPRWYSDIILYDSPFTPYAWEQDGLIKWRIHTHVVDLSTPFDELFARFRKIIRRHCRAAEKSGITASVADDLADVDEYYNAYLDSLRRWGENATAYYPRSLFHALYRLQRDGHGVRIWVAKLNGRVISGVIVLHHGAHSVAWHSATHSEFLSLHASPYVHMSAIKSGCADGDRWYDFNPSGRLRGVEHFKEGFATERRQFNMYHSPGLTRPLDPRPPDLDERGAD